MASSVPNEYIRYTLPELIMKRINAARDEVFSDISIEERKKYTGTDPNIKICFIGNQRHMSQFHIGTFQCFDKFYSRPILWKIVGLNIHVITPILNSVRLDLEFDKESRSQENFQSLYQSISKFLKFNGFQIAWDLYESGESGRCYITLANADSLSHAEKLANEFKHNENIKEIIGTTIQSQDLQLYQCYGQIGTVVATFASSRVQCDDE